MIDSGADRDVISETITHRLGLETTWTDLRVVTVDNEISSKRKLAKFSIESLEESYSAEVSDGLVGTILTGESDIAPHLRDISKMAHLQGISFQKCHEGVHLIIGAAHAEAWLPSEIRRGGERERLLGLRCKFGWTIVGRHGTSGESNITINAISADNVQLKESLDRIFYHDFAIVSEEELGESKGNKDAIEQLAKSIRFDDDVKKYFVGLPWKMPREEITKKFNTLKSRDMAMRRLKGMIPRLHRDPEKRKRVFAEIQKFSDTGVAIEIDSIDDDASAPFPRWHLPLHIVEKRNKTRVCHDARASTSGCCLNDFLLGGPNLVNSLAEIILYSRIWKFVLMNDIRSFFHQVRVDPKDVGAFRFPWFVDENLREAKMMSFQSHVFGSAASSIVTAYVLRHHAESIKNDYHPSVYDWIRNRFYVDDGTGGANTAEELIALSEGVIDAMKKGGFELCKFKSNLPQLMDGSGNEEVRIGDRNESEDATKILGVSWIPSPDVFTFNYDEEIATREIETPRDLVSVQASLHDPLGLISPFQLSGRKMLQRCEPQKRGWDAPLEPKLRQEFENWARSIPLLANLRIPRWWNCGIDNPTSSSLHIFCDAAATSGFGACAYRRVTDSAGNVKIVLICSRSHVVPIDPSRASHHNSTPRLELTSAEKAVEIRKFIERATNAPFDYVYLWTDSESSLKMINDLTSRFRLFFSNRLSKIHAASTVSEWRYVDSANNPADYTSRGINANETLKWEIFHFGPKFLYKPESEWPITDIFRSPNLHIYATTISNVPSESHYFLIEATANVSTWHGKMRRAAFIIFSARRWKAAVGARTRRARANLPLVENIGRSEIEEAEKRIICELQRKHFANEIEDLKASGVNTPNARGNVKKQSKSLRPHNPYIDDDGLLRVGSRLINANLDCERKCPIIIPAKDKITYAMLRHNHAILQHAGPKQTLTHTRQKYWVNKGLQATKSVIAKCVPCQKRFKRPLSQKMAPLPEFRVNVAAPFERTCLDLAGHFETRMNGRASHKIWLAIFSCCVTRAVHAEIVYKLDSDSLINAITRFTSRRPGVRTFISDRGTNMIGANAILRREWNAWRETVAPELHKKGLEWTFIPAGTPHYGGIWERVVGLFKKHITSATRGDILHVDTFNTIVVEIEGILNRRPLTPMSDDPNDTESITPAHILYPSTFAHSSSVIIPENAHDSHAQASWKRAQNRISAFWRVWSSEYLDLLHSRSKWQSTRDDMRIGDLVILVDESTHRHGWRMARVIRVFKKDNHVIKVIVRRGDGREIEKDRTKVVHLELDEKPTPSNG